MSGVMNFVQSLGGGMHSLGAFTLCLNYVYVSAFVANKQKHLPLNSTFLGSISCIVSAHQI